MAVASRNTSSLVVTGLTNGQDYLFTIATINQAGGTAGTTSAVGVPGAAPAVPTSLTATTGNQQASLSWVAPTSSGGSAITSYVITVAPAITGSPFNTGSANTSAVIT